MLAVGVVIGRQGQSKQTDSNCPEMYFIAVGGGGGGGVIRHCFIQRVTFPRSSCLGDYQLPKG